MKYTTVINDPRTGFDTVLNAAEKFNCDRFIFALKYKNYKEEAIIKLRDEVAHHRIIMEKEHERLLKFSQIFNKEFVTDDNKCFDSALSILHKLRTTISQVKLIVKRFCPRPRRDALAKHLCNKLVSAYDYSYISSDIYQLDMFRFEGYPDCVNELYNEMEKFFIVLVRSMQLCIQVLEDEDNIRKDRNYCYALYEDLKETILKEIAEIVLMISPDSPELQEKNNPLIKERYNYDSDLAWAPVGFHNGTRLQVKQLIIKQLLAQQQAGDLTMDEIMIFGNDSEKVHKYRHIIMNFGDLLPDNYHRSHLPAKHIQMFFQYVGIPVGQEKKAVQYFYETYRRNPINQLYNVSYQAVNNYKTEVQNDVDGCYSQFVNRLRLCFFKTIDMQKRG